MSTQQPRLLPDRPLVSVDEVNAALTRLRNEKCHIIPASLPERIQAVPLSNQVLMTGKFFDPRPDGPDFYHHKQMPNGAVGLKHSALVELWNSMGGRPVLSTRVDEGHDPNMVEWKYTGEFRELGGAWKPEEASKRVDLRDGSAQTQGFSSPAQLGTERATIYEKAESKAMSRMIRKALGIRAHYSAEEAEWPFVVVRLMFVPDMTNPFVAAIATADAMGSTRALFGSASFMQGLIQASSNLKEQDHFEEPERQIASGQPSKAIAAQAETQQKAPSVPSVADFQAYTEPDQLKTLEVLQTRKGYVMPDATKAIYKPSSPDHRLSFFNKLIALPDKEVSDPFAL